MSEKKTTGKQEHTLTLEDQAKLAQANAKKMEQGKVKFILLEQIGHGIIDRSVSDEEILSAIDYILGAGDRA